MKKFAESIEKSMAANLFGINEKLELEARAIGHLETAQNILVNAGFDDESILVSRILGQEVPGFVVDPASDVLSELIGKEVANMSSEASDAFNIIKPGRR